MKKESKKTKIKRISAIESLPDIVEIGEYKGDGVVELYRQNKKTLCCVLKISGIDIFHYTDEDKQNAFRSFATATMSLHIPYKYVFTDAHPNLKSQIEYLQYKERKADHSFAKKVLRNQIEILKSKEKTQSDKLAFLMLFSDNLSELKSNAENFAVNMVETSVEICEKAQVYEFFCNLMRCSSKNAAKDNMLPDMARFAPSSVQTNENYQTTLVIYDYPAVLKNLEIASLISRIDDVMFTLDVETIPKAQVMKELKYSLKELRSRRVLNQEADEESDTALEFEKLMTIRNDIANGSEQMMYTTLRIIVTANEYKALERRVKDIKQLLEEEGISVFVPINNLQKEYVLRVSPANTVRTPMPLNDTYRMQYPFYYQSHLDPTGMIFGVSGTGGLVNFDFFTRTPMRPSFDILLSGIKGSGKSVALKSLVQDYLVLGNKILVLDIESEYSDLAKIYGGQIIKFNNNSLLNTLQLNKVVDFSREDDNFDETSEIAVNFASEISRIISFFYQYIPELSDLEAEELKDIIVETYAQKNITDTTDVTMLKATDFPIFSDVLAVTRKRLYRSDGNFNKLTDRKIDILEKLEIYLKSLAEGMYRSMFNGCSNVEITDNNLIIFDVKGLSQLDERIYEAQLFNIVSLMWAETCKNIDYNERITHPFDRRYVISVIDEAHRFINANNSHVTNFIDQEIRRTRKYDASLWLASQAISDFNPSGTSAGAEKVRTIFSLIQYKIILKQSPDSLSDLEASLKSFPRSELISTKDFIPGEMLIGFGSDKNRIHCLRTINDIALFYVGNSRDREQIVHKLFDTYYHEKSKEEYARLLKRQEGRFHEIFTGEILKHYGFSKYDSEHLYNLVYVAVGKLIQELLMLTDKVGDSYGI